MKNLHLAIVIIIVALMSLSNQLSFAQEIPLTQVSYQVNLDRLNYQNTDILHIFLAGKPNDTVNLNIFNHFDLKKFSDVIYPGKDGLVIYSLNLTSYGPDTYFAILSKDNNDIAKLGFAVDLSPSGGYRVEMNTTKLEFHLGDSIPIKGILDSNSTIHMTLTDPKNMSQYSNTTQSDATGIFSTTLHIPTHSTTGIWKIDATNGKHDRQSIILVHPNNQTISEYPVHCCAESVMTTKLMNSPLKQFESGITANNVSCNNGLQLIIKADDGYPVCVKSDTANVLIERGWAKSV